MYKEFSNKSKEDWVSIINDQLKGAQFEDLQLKVGGISFDPCYTQDEVEGIFSDSAVGLPHSRATQSSSWLIGEDFVVKRGEEDQINKLLVDALMYGINAPKIILSDPGINWSTLLKDVNLQYIDLSLEGYLKGLGNYLDQIGLDISQLSGSVNRTLVSPFNFRKNLICLNCCAKDMKEQLTEAFVFLRNEVEENPEAASSLAISLNLGDHFLENCIRIRSVQSLWTNMLRGFNMDAHIPIFIDAYADTSSYSDDPLNNMIPATSRAISAIISGVDRLTVKIDSDENQTNRRMARNISHLSMVEGDLDKLENPLDGSYLVEKMTFEICNQVWDNL